MKQFIDFNYCPLQLEILKGRISQNKHYGNISVDSNQTDII